MGTPQEEQKEYPDPMHVDVVKEKDEANDRIVSKVLSHEDIVYSEDEVAGWEPAPTDSEVEPLVSKDEMSEGEERKPVKYRINITKPDEGKWGLDIMREKETDTVLVQRVKDGPFKVWNVDNPDRVLVEGCRIFEINGYSNAASIFEQFKLSEMNMMVLNPAG